MAKKPNPFVDVNKKRKTREELEKLSKGKMTIRKLLELEQKYN